MARTVDPFDLSEVERELERQFDELLEPHLNRLLEVYVASPYREGSELVSGRSDGVAVRLHVSYHSWRLIRPKLADKTGTGVASLALELARFVLPKGTKVQLYAQVKQTFGLDIDVDQVVSDHVGTKVAHAVVPAPEHYLPVPMPDEIRALADKGSKDLLVRLFCEAADVYRYENVRGEFFYYKLRLEDRAQATKKFLRAAYTAQDGLRVEGRQLRIQVNAELPLYNLRELQTRPDDPVLIVEGERTQAAAKRRFPEFVCVCWDGGAKNVKDTDWVPLSTRDVFILPDNDTPGMSAAHQIIGRLRDVFNQWARPNDRHPIRVLIRPPLELPRGHDVADPDPRGLEGWAEKAVAEARQPDPDILRLNSRYVFVNSDESGEAYVLIKNPRDVNGVGLSHVRLTQKEFVSRFVNDLRPVVSGRSVTDVPLGKLWLESPDRATVHSVVFNPDPNYVDREDVYNLWRGFAVTPEPGEFPTIRRLLDSLSEDPAVVLYVERFLAHLFQKPHQLSKRALSIRGLQGAGKTLFIDLISAMVGRHYTLKATSPENDLLGAFNDGLANKLIVNVEEISTNSANRAANKIKAMITSDTLTINAKNQPVRVVRNMARFFWSSNDEASTASGPDSRRFIYVTMRQSLSAEEMTAFANATINAGGSLDHPELRAFMHHLLTLDLADWESQPTPDTADQRMNRAMAIDQNVELSWLIDALTSGYVSGVPFIGRVVPIEAFDKDYEEYAFRHRIGRRLGKILHRRLLKTYLYGRDRGQTIHFPRVRGAAAQLGLSEETRGRLGLPDSLLEVLHVPPLEEILANLRQEVGVTLDPADLAIAEPLQPTLPDGRPEPF